MKISKYLPTIPTTFALFYFPFLEKADQYLDPGTGSIVIQVVIGIAVGGLAAVGLYWRRGRMYLKNLFSRDKKIDRIDDK